MGLVDDDRVVRVKEAVALHFCQQNAVGHELDRGGGRDAIVEADGVADRLANLLAQLRGYTLRHRARRDSARLGVADKPAPPAAELQTNFRNLGGLTGTGLASDDDDLIVVDGLRNIVAATRNRQRIRVGDLRYRVCDLLHPLLRLGDVRGNRRSRVRRPRLAQPTPKRARLRKGDTVECRVELLARRCRGLVGVRSVGISHGQRASLPVFAADLRTGPVRPPGQFPP